MAASRDVSPTSTMPYVPTLLHILPASRWRTPSAPGPHASARRMLYLASAHEALVSTLIPCCAYRRSDTQYQASTHVVLGATHAVLGGNTGTERQPLQPRSPALAVPEGAPGCGGGHLHAARAEEPASAAAVHAGVEEPPGGLTPHDCRQSGAPPASCWW
jgi:hypothetical protein